MTTQRMVTVTDKYDDTQSLAGTGQNTIRKASDKYRAMRPGDVVQMDFGPADAEGVDIVIHATEYLTVTSVVIAPYADIMNIHHAMNHGAMDEDTMHEFLKKCYGDFTNSTEFVAVYFQ